MGSAFCICEHCGKPFESSGPGFRDCPECAKIDFRVGHKRKRYSRSYVHWRRAVLVRDHYTCQFCGETEGRLEVHHILHWAGNKKKRFVVSNGLTLCYFCHKQLHFPKKDLTS